MGTLTFYKPEIAEKWCFPLKTILIINWWIDKLLQILIIKSSTIAIVLRKQNPETRKKPKQITGHVN